MDAGAREAASRRKARVGEEARDRAAAHFQA